MKTHKDLEVWKNSMELARMAYRVSADFPGKEIFGLTDQIRRAAVSIPANIAEGAARKSTKEFRHFLNISFASLIELETLLILSADFQYLSNENFINIHSLIKLLTLQISKLIKALERKITNHTNLT